MLVKFNLRSAKWPKNRQKSYIKMSDLVLTNKQILMINLLTNQGRKTSLQRSCASSSTIWYQGVIGSMTPRLSVKLHRARLNQSQPNHVVLIFARVKQGGGGGLYMEWSIFGILRYLKCDRRYMSKQVTRHFLWRVKVAVIPIQHNE